MRQALITSILYFIYRLLLDEGDNPATYKQCGIIFATVLAINLIFDCLGF